ncbi:unnamed protein product [Angiostrongylus costaricensis]|uniref:Uncharacterized protein n=1 Tax=Angiostrongylus costaricensis TaxID=334426 RepID=A0A0R3Q0G9_ANGCS|nr:unnamed protein product [Angiostrongylus costaricensis]
MRMNDSRWTNAILAGFFELSYLLQEDQPDDNSSSRKLLKKGMILNESLERAEPTKLLLRTTEEMEELLAAAPVPRRSTGLEVIGDRNGNGACNAADRGAQQYPWDRPRTPGPVAFRPFGFGKLVLDLSRRIAALTECIGRPPRVSV